MLMSICRTTIVEYHSEADADAMTADYIANFESMFPECEQSINSRVGPTTVAAPIASARNLDQLKEIMPLITLTEEELGRLS